jgi:hypothetical protein
MSAKDLIQLGSAYNSLPMLVAGSCLISLDGAPCLLLSDQRRMWTVFDRDFRQAINPAGSGIVKQSMGAIGTGEE